MVAAFGHRPPALARSEATAWTASFLLGRHVVVPAPYLQVRKGSNAQKRLDENANAIRAAVESFTSETTRGYYRRGEWVTIGIRRSLVEVARAAAPTDATTSFFRECVTSPRGKELLELHRRAVRQPPSRVTTSDEGVA